MPPPKPECFASPPSRVDADPKRTRRERIRAQSRAVAAYVAASPEAGAFHEDWGTPTAEGGAG